MARTEPFEPHARPVHGESPINDHPRRVAVIFPGLRLADPCRLFTDATVPTLALKNTAMEELIAQPLPDVAQCPVCSWAGPNAVPHNTRHHLRK